MTTAVILFSIGLLCLIKGGDWFVDGAVNVAHRFGVPELLVGATVVSIGTTLPEVMVSTTSALTGHSEIAYGNAIGSIICNTALIAAITVTVKPGPVDKKALRTPVLFFFGTAVLYAMASYLKGYLSRAMGLMLLGIFVLYMAVTVVQIKKMPSEGTDSKDTYKEEPGESRKEEHSEGRGKKSKENETDQSLGKDLCQLLMGAVLIAIGADLLVDNGTLIAQALGVPESVIALTFVALGTSLPELATAITSLLKGHGALSLGNVIGANFFNLVLVSGISVTLAPFRIPQSSTLFGHNASLVMELPVMFTVMLLLTLPPLIKGKLARAQGILLLLIYGAFCIVQFTL